MTKICGIREISPDGKKRDLGYLRVALSSYVIQINGDEMVQISFKHITAYADSMASDGTKEDNFEGLMFRIDIKDGRKMIFEYAYDQDEKAESEAYEEIFDRFVAPLREHFMKEVFEKKISDLTEYDLKKLYGTFRKQPDNNRQRKYLTGIFVLLFVLPFMYLFWPKYPFGRLLDLGIGATISILVWYATLFLEGQIWEVSPQGYRFTSRLYSAWIPWDSVFKFTKEERRSGFGGTDVGFVYVLHYRKEGKELRFEMNTYEPEFQRILRICRTKLQHVPQFKSRGYSPFRNRGTDFVTWPLD